MYPHARLRHHHDAHVWVCVWVCVRMLPFSRSQVKEIEAFKMSDELAIPTGLDFIAALPSISKEESEILTRVQPGSIHAAKKIPGIRPSTLMMLYQVAKRHARDAKTAAAAAAAASM